MSYLEDREKKAIDKMKFDLANRKFEEYPKFVGDVIVNSKEEEEKITGKKKLSKK